MAATIHFGSRIPFRSERAVATGGAKLVPAEDVLAATGWEIKPEGACQGDTCIPLPPAARPGSSVDLAFLARALGRPLVHEGDIWVAGEPAAARAAALQSLEAPDFELPDLAGRPHHLSDYRGRKLALLSWASW